MTKFILGLLMMSGPTSFAALTEDGKVVQDRIAVECQNDRGTLKFNYNRSTQVAVFTEKSAMGRAELPVNEPIAALIEGNDLKITYDWYFVAEYALSFPKSIYALKAGDQVWMTFDGDDNDGFIFNDVFFNCAIK